MKKKGLAFFIFSLLFLSLFLVSCPLDDPEFEIPELPCNICNSRPCNCSGNGIEIVGDPLGPWTGTWTGHGYGQGYNWSSHWREQFPEGTPIHVRVEVTIEDGFIKSLDNIVAEGRGESPEFWKSTTDVMLPLVVRYNHFDIRQVRPDIISGNTYTYNGISQAGNAAIRMAEQAWRAATTPTITVDPTRVINAGQSVPMNPIVTPVGTTVTWVSSNEAIATVNAQGVISAVSAGATPPGIAIITGTHSEDTDVTVNVVVFVLP